MNSQVPLWRQFWLGGDDAYKNLIVAGARIQVISAALKERLEDNGSTGTVNSTPRLNLRRLSRTFYVASGICCLQTMGNSIRCCVRFSL